jgi:predicted permease
MSARAPRPYRVLLRILPAAFRQRHQTELETAFLACLERSRQRGRRAGMLSAWVGGVLDLVATAIVLRMDAHRRSMIAALSQPHESQGDSFMMNLWHDVRYAVRMVGRSPGFSAVVVLTLALTIGLNAAIFSVVDAVLLRPLPYRDAGRLALVYEAIPRASSGPIGFSAPDFRAFETRVTSFEGVAAFGGRQFELSGIDRPERVTAARVSAALFDVLGVAPALGRAFSREDDEGRRPVVILTDGLWRRKYGADAGIVGRSIWLDRRSYTVVAVMPPGFVFPNRGTRINNAPADVYVPISFTTDELTGFASMYNNSVVARLKSGVTLEQADAEVRTVVGQLVRDIYPAPFRDGSFALSGSALSLRDETVGRVSTLLYVIFAAVGVVLLIACADIASLMLTRAAGRTREMAVRVALGAGRGTLVRQVLLETGALAVCGGVLGVFLAYWASGVFVRLAPAAMPRLHEVAVDGRVLGFGFLLSCVTALLCGLIPALELSRRPSGDTLKDGGRGATSGLGRRRMFGVLVTAQFALAVVLLVAGGLLVRSLNRLMSVDPGFRADHVLTLATSLPAEAYPRASDVRGFYSRLLERVDALPGISATATATDLPLSIRERRSFTIEMQPAATVDLPHVVAHDWIAGRYFDAMGIAITRGRGIGPEDTADSERVVVINETMARRFWPGEDPLGRRIAWGGSPDHRGPWMRIVGVAADIKQGPLNSDTEPQTFQPSSQVSDQMVADNVWGGLRALKVIVRSQTEPSATAAAVAAQVRTLDPSLPLAQVRTMEDVVTESAGPHRFNTTVLASFASAALLLAALGIAGVLATSVSQRTQELGVRMALGAQRGDLLRMVLRQGMALALTGLAIGLPAAFAVTRVMSTLLFEVSPRDPATFAAVTAVLVIVALTASYLPARRATRVDPIVALRYE